MTPRELIDRMKAANTQGNFGLPEGIVDEWRATQEARRLSGTSHYTRLIDAATNDIVAEVPSR